MIDLKSIIRDVPDFPKKGIVFRDITTLLKDAKAFRQAVEQLCAPYRGRKVDAIVGIESRGFIFGGAMAVELDVSFVPARKPGKLPADTVKEEYALEYGTDGIEVHKDGIRTMLQSILFLHGIGRKSMLWSMERMGLRCTRMESGRVCRFWSWMISWPLEGRLQPQFSS